jgi:regulator of sigma E protease
MTFISAIVLLGILIFVHELGHFLFAKLMKVRVLKFSLGFGPKLVGKKYGDTEYLISAVPLGGYVKMLGEEPGEELTAEDRARAYNYQPVWKRFLIVLSGPVFNIFFASVLFIIIFIYGVPALFPDVGEVMKDSPAEQVGLMKGDRIIEIQGTKITEWSEMTGIIYESPNKSLNFKIQRDDEIIELTITPEKKTVTNIFGEEEEIGLIGIRPLGNKFTKKYSVPEAFYFGIKRTVEIAVLTVVSIIKLIQRIIPAETIGGPILILQMAGEQAARGMMNFFTFMAVISINLGVINLLPIPVLDGGHIMFLGIELFRRKPLSERAMATAQKVGLAVIIVIMAFALYNDIIRVVTGRGTP